MCYVPLLQTHATYWLADERCVCVLFAYLFLFLLGKSKRPPFTEYAAAVTSRITTILLVLTLPYFAHSLSPQNVGNSSSSTRPTLTLNDTRSSVCVCVCVCVQEHVNTIAYDKLKCFWFLR